MEPLGKKLEAARLKKNVSLEEASRVTKIRASRIQEIEQEDFSGFTSLAYAKGFLLIYGKFLDVDVTPYLDAFETSREVTVDGYSYLQDGPATAPLPVARRPSTKRPALLPLIIAIGVLVFGIYLVKLLLDIQRITPRTEGLGAVVTATATPTASPAAAIVAPRAQSVDEPPASEALVTAAPNVAATAIPRAIPVAPAAASPVPTEPEVRRALPVRPGDFPSPNDAVSTNRVEITPVQMTYMRVTVDNALQPAYDGWLEPSHAPVSFEGHRLRVTVLDRGAVQITKNGVALGASDPDITFE